MRVEFNASDLILQELVNLNGNRKVASDLYLYCHFWERGSEGLAHWQALGFLRPRPKEDIIMLEPFLCHKQLILAANMSCISNKNMNFIKAY